MLEPFILPPRFFFGSFFGTVVRCTMQTGWFQQRSFTTMLHAFGYCRLRWLTLSFGKFDPELKSNPLAERNAVGVFFDIEMKYELNSNKNLGFQWVSKQVDCEL